MSKEKNIAELSIELSLENKQFSKAMKTIDKEITSTERKFKAAGKGVNNYENTFKGLDAKITKTSKQLDLYNKKLEKQKQEYDSLKSVLNAQTKELEKIENTLGKGSKEWKQQADLVTKNSEKLNKLSTDIKITEGNISQLTNELNKSKDEFKALDTNTQNIDEKLEDINRSAALTQSEFEKLGAELKISGGYFQKLGHELKEISSKIEHGTNKIELYKDTIQHLSQALNKSKQDHNKLETEITKTQQVLNKTSKEYGSSAKETIELKNKLLNLKDQYSSLSREIKENETALENYKIELNGAQKEVNELARELKQLPFETLGNTIKNTGATVKNVGNSLTLGLTTPLALAGGAAVKTGTDFTTAMSALQATAGIADKTSDSYIKLKRKAEEMGSSTSFSATQAAEGLQFLSLAGWDVDTSISRIEKVLRGAEAAGIDLGLAADLITDSMSAAGIESEQFGKYLDIAAEAQRKSNQNMQQLFEANIVAGGSFKMLKIPMAEANSLLGVLANRGIKGSEAGKALASVFANIVTESGQAGEALKKMGIHLHDSKDKQRDMVDVLKELRGKLINTADGTNKLTEKQQQQYAAMLGGKTQFDTLMALLDGLGGEYDNLVKDLQNADGALEEVSHTMKDNLGGEIDNMKSAIEGSLIKAFEALEPVLSKIVGWITDAANWFTNLDEESQKNIITMGMLAATLGPILSGLGSLIIVGGNAVTLFGSLAAKGAGASAATGGLTSALGFLASPAGIGVAVAALAGLMAMLGENEGALLMLQEKFGGLGTTIGAVCEFVSGMVQQSFGSVAIIVMGVFDIIGAFIDGPGGATVSDAVEKMNNRLILNTEESMSKMVLSTTRGMSQMRNSTEENLNDMLNTMTITLDSVPKIFEGNYSAAAQIMAKELFHMDNQQLNILKNMNDTSRMLFQGINENMTVDQSSQQVEKNLKQMQKAGKLNGDQMSEDISAAMEIFQKQIKEKTKDGTSAAVENTSQLAEEVDKNTTAAATAATENMTAAQKGTNTAAQGMASDAIRHASNMEKNVSNETSIMAKNAINDWDKIQRKYSQSIRGNISVNKITYESKQEATTRDINNLDTELTAIKNLTSDYATTGSYYNNDNYSNINNFNTQNDNINNSNKRNLQQENKFIVNINIENFNGENEKDINKLAAAIDHKLKQFENRFKKNKGGGIIVY